MTTNQIFREFNCGLSIGDVAQICCKSIGTVQGWDKGNPIPNECRKLMKIHKRMALSHYEEWKGFKVVANKLELPTDQLVSPQQVLTGIALLEIQSELEIKTSRKLLSCARVLASLK